MATTGHENEPVNVSGLKAALQQYKTSISDARTIIPVDEEALTPSSTFVKGNVVGINGTFYYCTANTSNFPVILATQGNAFVVNVIDGKRCFIVSNNTLQTGWMLWSDASVEYQLANFQQQINGKQNTLTFDSTPTANSPNPVTSGGIYNAINYKPAIVEKTTLPLHGNTDYLTPGTYILRNDDTSTEIYLYFYEPVDNLQHNYVYYVECAASRRINCNFKRANGTSYGKSDGLLTTYAGWHRIDVTMSYPFFTVEMRMITDVYKKT